MGKREEDELTGKNVAWYQTFIGAWVESRMEKDKQVLTLSALGIGLLVTMKDDLTGVISGACWFAAGFSFLCAMITTLVIFDKNGDYIENLIANDNQETMKNNEKTLGDLTKIAFMLFILGAFFTIAFVFSNLTIKSKWNLKNERWYI